MPENFILRQSGIAHRSAIAAVDKLSTPVAGTLVDVTTGGSLLANTAYNTSVACGNRWGPTTPSTADNITTAADASNTHKVRIPITIVTGADYYDIFLSTDANPKWVARITEAQRLSGCVVTAVGTVGAGGAANSVDVSVVGTGVANNAAPFTANNAYTPANVTAFDCQYKHTADLLIKVAVTDLRSAPTLKLLPFFKSAASPNDWHQGDLITLSLLTAVGESLEQDVSLSVDGIRSVVILVDTISGQGTTASIWAELS